MTKQEFLRQVNERLKTMRDPKLLASRRCVAGARAYELMTRRAKTAKAEKKVKNAKSKLQ